MQEMMAATGGQPMQEMQSLELEARIAQLIAEGMAQLKQLSGQLTAPGPDPLVQLKEKEFSLHNDNFGTVGTQSAVIAGFTMTALVEITMPLAPRSLPPLLKRELVRVRLPGVGVILIEKDRVHEDLLLCGSPMDHSHCDSGQGL